jgi:excinuclease UvrABC nuclease subunit
MVVFKGGSRIRRDIALRHQRVYRADDYASMAEVLERRLHRYEEEKDSGGDSVVCRI